MSALHGATPVIRRAHEEESAILDALIVQPFETVLVVSDLHLGEGRDGETGVFRAQENFTSDDAFARLIRNEASRSARRLLVLLGDTFDFLRITRVPSTEDDFAAWSGWLERLGEPERAAHLPRRMPWVERRYGLRTQDWKTVWKLHVILEGHPEFQAALVAWLQAGGDIVLAKGNHDVELYWPLVRQAIRDAILRGGAERENVERVAFADRSFVLDNVYFEHGHEYEGMTRVVGPPVLPGREGEINLPLGSFVNRYFINRIERLDPFVDNRKPVQQALLALLRRRPLVFVKIYLDGLRFFAKALRRAGTLHGAGALGLLVLFYLPFLLVPIAIVWLWPGGKEFILDHLPFLRIRWAPAASVVGVLLSPVLLPYVVGVVREVLTRAGIMGERDNLAEGASSRLRDLLLARRTSERAYAVMGHTHRQTVKRLSRNGNHELYVNTGTWIPLWPSNRPDLAGRVILSVTKFDRETSGDWRHVALEWHDEASELRPAKILAFEDS